MNASIQGLAFERCKINKLALWNWYCFYPQSSWKRWTSARYVQKPALAMAINCSSETFGLQKWSSGPSPPCIFEKKNNPCFLKKTAWIFNVNLEDVAFFPNPLTSSTKFRFNLNFTNFTKKITNKKNKTTTHHQPTNQPTNDTNHPTPHNGHGFPHSLASSRWSQHAPWSNSEYKFAKLLKRPSGWRDEVEVSVGVGRGWLLESPLWLCRVYNAEIINGWTGVTETEVFLFFFWFGVVAGGKGSVGG